MEPIKHPDLQLDERLPFQQRLFWVRLAGITVLLAGVLAALAGVLGDSGPLARASVSAGALSAEYPRFARYRAPAVLTFELAPDAVAGDRFDLLLSGDYAREFEIEHVQPQPAGVATGSDGLRFTFDAGPGTPRVRIEGRPEAIGPMSGTATVAGQPPLDIGGFVHP